MKSFLFFKKKHPSCFFLYFYFFSKPKTPLKLQHKELKEAFKNTRFSSPVFMTQSPSKETFYVVEQGGLIKAIIPSKKANSAPQVITFANLRNKVSQQGGEMGLLGMAFSPNYEKDRSAFVAYTTQKPIRFVLAKIKRSNTDEFVADPVFHEIILEAPKDFREYTNHNGGMIAFGPDGMLYVGIGDGGGAGDLYNNAQNTQNLWGKILRLDVSGQSSYKIPPDNPFVSKKRYRGEIWALGLRNPWRFSFDKSNGLLWVGDVGQNKIEEIIIVKKGKNYGWRFFEGTSIFNNPQKLPLNSFETPLWEYPHSEGKSITGGYVYRGKKIPALQGHYIYGDYVSGKIWALKHDKQKALTNFELIQSATPSSFAEDHAGELYILSHSSGIVYIIHSR